MGNSGRRKCDGTMYPLRQELCLLSRIVIDIIERWEEYEAGHYI